MIHTTPILLTGSTLHLNNQATGNNARISVAGALLELSNDVRAHKQRTVELNSM